MALYSRNLRSSQAKEDRKGRKEVNNVISDIKLADSNFSDNINR